MEKEIYKQHPIYYEYYGCSNGRIYSTRSSGRGKDSVFPVVKLLSDSYLSNGYKKVSIRSKNGKQDNYLAHRFIAECFIDNGSDRNLTVSHLNGIRDDNRPVNLIMESLKDNHSRKKKHGTSDCGHRNSRSKLNIEQISKVKELLKEKQMTHKSIGEMFGVSRVFITKINNGYRYKY